MPINAEPLRKILELEGEKGYLDSAVIGGLDRFLGNWARQAVESITTPPLLNRFNKLHLVDLNYASLTKEQRKEWIDNTLDFLADVERGEKEKGKARPVPVASPPPPAGKRRKSAVNQSIDSPITVIKGISANCSSNSANYRSRNWGFKCCRPFGRILVH